MLNRKKNNNTASLKLNLILSIIKQICTLLFPLISIPYISRILGVESYGIYNFGNSIVGYFSLISMLGVSTYAIREGAAIRNNRDEINQFSSEVFSINMVSTVLSYFLLAITLLSFPTIRNYSVVILVLSASIMFSTIGADWINTIYEDFLYITIRYIVIQVLSITAMFMFVRSANDYVAYALITVIASAGANLFNVKYIRKYVKLTFTIKMNSKKHLRPIMMLFFSNLAITIYVNSDITMLGLMANDSAVGIYSLATKVYSIVKQLLNAIMIVSIPRLASYLHKNIDQYNQLLKKILELTITFVIPAVVGLAFLSPNIVALVGGEEYNASGNCLAILAIALIFSTIAYFFVNCILIIYKKEKFVLYVSLLSAVVNIVFNIYFIPRFSYVGTSITTVISEGLVFIVCLFKVKKLISFRIDKRTISGCLLGCVFVLFSCLCFNYFCGIGYISTLICIFISVVLYFIVNIFSGNPVIKDELHIIMNRIKKNDRRIK